MNSTSILLTYEVLNHYITYYDITNSFIFVFQLIFELREQLRSRDEYISCLEQTLKKKEEEMKEKDRVIGILRAQSEE